MIQFVILSVLLISTCAAKFDKIVELDVLLNEKREFTNAAIFEAGTANNLTVPFKYPLFKQCADAWGEDLMDTKTVCQVVR
jgi:hypothetical protein